MLKLWKMYWEATWETKLFVIVCFLFGVSILITTVHSYGRLDFVRSYKTTPSETTDKT